MANECGFQYVKKQSYKTKDKTNVTAAMQWQMPRDNVKQDQL